MRDLRFRFARAASPAMVAFCMSAFLGCSTPAVHTNLTGYPGDQCQPLVDASECFLPFPSDFFRKPDAAMAAGFRIRIPAPAVVFDKAERSTDSTAWRALDGSSLMPMIVGRLGHTFSQASLVGLLDDPAPTVNGTSPIALVEADTGRFVAHYEDVDADIEDSSQQTFIVSPLERLKPSTRYVVFVRGLVDDKGVAVAPAEGFRMLRDGVASNDDAVGPAVEGFERDVFPVAERVHIARASLQLAWSFTTGSMAQATGDAKRAVSLIKSELDSHPPTVTITRVAEPTTGLWGRKVYGTLNLPSVLTGKGEPEALLARDASGAVMLNGRIEVPFRALVPRSVLAGQGKAHALIYGHGFFGSASEAEESAMTSIADESGSVLFAMDWLGMSANDIDVVGTRITHEPQLTPAFTELVAQSLADIAVLRRAVGEALLARPELRRSGESEALYDGVHVGYMGISQGHILGGIAVALDGGFDRAVLHVGGGALGQIVLRSQNFSVFLGLIGTRVSDPLARRRLLANLAPYLDRIDPVAYADDLHVKKHPADTGLPVLMQTGLGDTNVPHFAGMHHARALGLPLAKGSPAPVWGLTEEDLSGVSSAYQLFDRGWDPATYRVCAAATKVSSMHEALRRDPQAVNQLVVFLKTGVIVPAN